MSSLKKFDYRIKDNRKRNIFLCGIILVIVTIVGVKLYQSKAEFTGTSSELNLANGSVVIPGTYYLKELAKTSKELMYDETIDNNLRYIGKDPNNYVDFNGELWRIIGVMNNIDDGTGKKESRIKLIRDETLGEFKWDNKQKGVGSSVDEKGSNDWYDSQLMMMLNPKEVIEENWQNQESKKNYKINTDDTVTDTEGHVIFKKVGSYYNRTNGFKPAQATTTNFTEEEIDFSKIGLKDESKKYIDKVKWQLGSMNWNSHIQATNDEWYDAERGTNVLDNRPATWVGYVGLMYPSDYGYATSGGEKTDRKTCLENPIYMWGLSNSYNIDENPDCRNNDWLYKNEQYKWCITPMINDYYDAMDVYGDGHMSSTSSRFVAYVYPVVYLKSSIKIIDGTGSKEDSFQLE